MHKKQEKIHIYQRIEVIFLKTGRNRILAALIILISANLIWTYFYPKQLHKEDRLPEDLANSIIIFYRDDCGDCAAVYPELAAMLKGENAVYWIKSRSAQGMKLRGDYPIAAVPAAVYIESDGKTNHTVYLSEIKDGRTIFLKDNLERLLHLQDQRR